MVYRNRLAIVLIVAAALLVGLAYTLFMPRMYEASASVQVEPPVTSVAAPSGSQPASADAERYLQTQVEVLKSRAVAKRVAERLDLASSDEFMSAMPLSASDEALPGEHEEQVLLALQEHLSIELPDKSQVVRITFRSRDLQLTARVANAYADAYMAAHIERAVASGDYARKMLQEQLNEAKARLDASERALINYMRAAQLIRPGTETEEERHPGASGSLVTADLDHLKRALVDAKIVRLEAQQRWEQAQSAPATALPDVLSNPTMQQLLQRQAELNGQISAMRQHMRGDHPAVQRASAELHAIAQEIHGLGEGIRRSIRDRLSTAQGQEEALTQQVAALRSDILAQQDRGVRYDSLRREADTNQQTYAGLLRRYTELNGLAGAGAGTISVIDAAEAPSTPSSPRPLLTMAAAFIAGLLLGLLYAFGRERLDDTILDPTDVESKLNLALMGVIPEFKREDLHDALYAPAPARSYYLDHSALDLPTNMGAPTSILMTSSREGEGKSVTAFLLARDLAQIGRKVLLIDADLQRSGLHQFFDVGLDAPGLSNLLTHKLPTAEAIIQGAEGMPDFLPSGPRAPNPGVLVMRQALDQLLDALATEYEVVVLDGPPVNAWAQAARLTALASATVFVTEAGAAHFGQARAAVSRLARAQGNLVGCIVTKYNARKVGYTESGGFYDFSSSRAS